MKKKYKSEQAVALIYNRVPFALLSQWVAQDANHPVIEKLFACNRFSGEGQEAALILHEAIRHYAYLNTYELIKNNFFGNYCAFYEETPLHTICHYSQDTKNIQHSQNRIAIADVLIKNGADVNAKNYNEATPLFYVIGHYFKDKPIFNFYKEKKYALWVNQRKMLITALLRAGADLGAANKAGKTVFDLAFESHKTTLISLSHFAKKKQKTIKETMKRLLYTKTSLKRLPMDMINCIVGLMYPHTEPMESKI